MRRQGVSLTNKELADQLRATVNTLLEAGAESDQVSPIDEAARRLEFGYTPPEAPRAKSAIELKREEELYALKLSKAQKLEEAGMRIRGGIVYESSTGRCDMFALESDLAEFEKGKSLWRLRELFYHDGLGNEFMMRKEDF